MVVMLMMLLQVSPIHGTFHPVCPEQKGLACRAGASGEA